MRISVEQIYDYDIKLRVPLGIRKGRMHFVENEGIITGNIEVLGNITSFKGSIRDGTIEIEGVLKTFIRENPYRGKGTVDDGVLKVMLYCRNDVYELIGYLRKEV